MSQRDVERTLGRLVTDARFRRDFFQDPPRACLGLGLQLTAHELEALVATPRSALAVLCGRLDDRICRLSYGPADGRESPPPPAGESAGA